MRASAGAVLADVQLLPVLAVLRVGAVHQVLNALPGLHHVAAERHDRGGYFGATPRARLLGRQAPGRIADGRLGATGHQDLQTLRTL
jgi:hypothetical protein